MSINTTGAGSKGQTVAAMAFGTVIFIATLVAWLYGSQRGIDTTVLWSVVTPVIGFLFIGGALSKTADHAEQAAIQTNGSMEAKIKAQVSSALADRDAARTWQATSPLAPPVRVDAQVPQMEPDGPASTD
jgi:hypothetical protein